MPSRAKAKQTRLLAIDMQSGALVIDYQFAPSEAGFAQDMRVSEDGATIYLADTGLFKLSKANLIVFFVAKQTSRTLLGVIQRLAPRTE
jgi:hypothetical protein